MNKTAPKLVISGDYKVDGVIYPLLLAIDVVLGVMSVVKNGIDWGLFVCVVVGVLILVARRWILMDDRDTVTITEEAVTVERKGVATEVWSWEELHWRADRSHISSRTSGSTIYSAYIWTDRPSPLYDKDEKAYCLPGDYMMIQTAMLCCPKLPEGGNYTPQRDYAALTPDHILSPKKLEWNKKVRLFAYILGYVAWMAALAFYVLTGVDENVFFSPAFILFIAGGLLFIYQNEKDEAEVQSFAAEVFQRCILQRGVKHE